MNSRPDFVAKVPNVIGGDELVAKQSAVNEQGKLRAAPIEGVVFRPVRPVPHEDGHVTEVARASWGELAHPVVQVHLTTTFPGRIRAWGLHQASTDRLFVVSGLVKIVVYDGRHDLPTLGRVNEFTVSEKNPGLTYHPAEPLSRMEEHRHLGSNHHQYADLDVCL